MKLNEFFEYPITRPIPYGKLFHLSLLLFLIASFAVFVLWAAATAGYDTVSVTSINYNLRQNLWYDAFLPDLVKETQSRSLCNGVTTFTPGTSFTTTNDLFSYAIRSYYAGLGNTTRPGDSIEYTGTNLNKCSPADVFISVDMMRNTIDAASVVFCYEDWPVVATNHYTFSIDPVTNMLIPSARSSTGNDLWSNPQSISNFIFQDLGYLARDLLGTIKLAYSSSGQTTPVAYAISLKTPSICPVGYIGNATVNCPATKGTELIPLVPSDAADTFLNGSQKLYTGSSQQNMDFAIPIQNMAKAMYAATVYDLGSTDSISNNIFTDAAMLAQSIETVNDQAVTSGVAGSTLTGAQAFKADTNLPVPSTGAAVVRATFLCRIKQLKSAAGFIVAVLGLSSSLFSSTLGVATLIIVIVMRMRKPQVMSCVGHAKGCSSPTHSTSYYPAVSPSMQPQALAPTLPHQGYSNYSQNGWVEPKPYGGV